MRKLVVYRDAETLRQQAGGFPCLVNYDALRHCGEVDDGCGNFGHVEFVTVDTLPATIDHDHVELIGVDIDDVLRACAKAKEA